MAVGASFTAHAAEHANPSATPQVRTILNYFQELSARREGRRILSGQFSDFGNGADLRIMERIQEKTGHWPGLIGVDYADFGRGSLTYQTPDKVAIEYWKQGGLVTDYAGERYVDIVGIDAYTDFVDQQHIKGYEEIAALPKPFGFTEYGPHGSQNPPGNYDYRRFMNGLEKEFPRTCFFMCWNAKWSLATNDYTKELLAHSSVVNLEDLPANLFKTDK